VRWKRRAETAEAKLAAIKAECDSVNGAYSHPSALQEAALGAFDRIRALLTPAGPNGGAK
jgi:hypothetical protein